MSISAYIKDDLTIRLQTGQELPSHLTLDSLAEMYNVSFTPIRTAVNELIHEGLLTKGANRRLVATGQAVSTEASTKTADLPKPPQDSFELIASDLVKLSLEGKPVHLREEVTADKYNMSRSAIRNILHRLAGEGILDHIPRRGWRLRPFRPDDLKAFIEVREVLELKALQLSMPKLDPSRLQQMLDANVITDSGKGGPVIDESFHQYLIQTSGNTYIKEFFERQGRYFHLLFQWEDHDRETAVETVRQHREILSLLLQQNHASARKSLSHHILNNHPILSQIARPNGKK